MIRFQHTSRWRHVMLALAIGLGGQHPVAAQVITGVGPAGTPGMFGAARGLGAAPGYGSTLGSRGSLIGDGSGGFTLYHGRSRSRYLGPPAGPGTVHHPGGGTSSVMGDGSGGAIVNGPAGTHRHWTWPNDVSDLR